MLFAQSHVVPSSVSPSSSPFGSLMWEHPLTQSHLNVLKSIYFKGFAFHSDASLRGIGLGSPDPKGRFAQVTSAVIGSARKRSLRGYGGAAGAEGVSLGGVEGRARVGWVGRGEGGACELGIR